MEVVESYFTARCGTVALITLGAGVDQDAYDAMMTLVSRGLPGGPPGAETVEWLEAAAESQLGPDEIDEGALEDEEPEDYDPVLTIAPKGEGVLSVINALRRWLDRQPPGTADPGTGAALASLICAWFSTVAHVLAAEPLTLDALDRAVPALERDEVEEVLEDMETTGQAEPITVGEEAHYTLTDWMREGIGPVVAAVRQEGHYPDGLSDPPDVLDVEAAFQMALPLLRLPPQLRATCRLGARMPDDPGLIAGATVDLDRGAVITSTPLLEREPENWVTGTPLEWCDTVMEPTDPKLEIGGDFDLAGALIEALHEALYSGMEM